MEDNKGRINYYCQYCGTFKARKVESMIDHIKNCKIQFSNLTENIDYVQCKICNFHGQSLGAHLKRVHKISSENYIIKYNSVVICERSHNSYSDNTYRYLTEAKKNNIDLTDYWKKVSNGVKTAILSNPEEIDRRSKAMIELNNIQQSDTNFQKLVKETAKKTSARSEILEKRSSKLKEWRDNHPDDFYDKCIKKMINAFQSKPEKKLFEFVTSLDGFFFKRNQFVKSNMFSSKSRRKQIDMVDKTKRVYIEYDGQIHFKDYFGQNTLELNKKRDQELDKHISYHNWTLIRISYDQYIDKNKIEKSYFKQECLDKIIDILNNKQPGIYKIGEAYGQY